VGATGLVGGYCLERLLMEDVFVEVVVLTRTPLERTHPKLTERVIDFERLTEQRDLNGIDTVFCALGSTLKSAGSRSAFARVDFVYVKQLAELVAAGGARQFVLVSAVGASPRSPVFYSRIKGKAEAAVRALSFRTVHIVRPSMLLGTRRKPRFNEEFTKPLARIVMPLLAGPLRHLRPVLAAWVATMMVEVARQEEPGVYIHYPSAL
jgi:uncharacterized protein YbjT (DUF2867 family)